jgi:uncharacterized membrane protein (UPF0127 family)
LIVAVGEAPFEFAQIEAVAKINEKEIYNMNKFPYMKNIKINYKYDINNDFTCNKLNFFLLKRIDNFVFIHVPINKNKNEKIRIDLKQLVKYLSSSIKVHKIVAKVEKKFTRGYTGVDENNNCIRGLHFPFNDLQIHQMTMANTGIDLDILFLSKKQNDHFKILKIVHAKAYSKRTIEHKAFSVLEMPSKYCKINHVKRDNLIKLVT